MHLSEKRLFNKKPDESTGVLSIAFYAGNDDTIIRHTTFISKSDTFDKAYISFSYDNMKTFVDEKEILCRWKTSQGTMTRYFKSSFIHKTTNRLYLFYNSGLLPNGKPEEGMKNWQMHYEVWEGKMLTHSLPIIMDGDEYDEKHPINGVYIGRNSFMIGDYPCSPIETDEDTILLPVAVVPLDESGELLNPVGAYTYHYSAVLKGKIQNNGLIRWISISEPISNDPRLSTRGVFESVLSMSPDGRILMLSRGSNDKNHDIPGYRWYSVSEDKGDTWSKIKPWTYETGENFYSPSSCSQIINHSNGKMYWIGNISKDNPRGNMPRNPLYIGEIDEKSLLLKKDSLFIVEERKPHQFTDVCFSNFYCRQEHNSNDILIYCTSFWQDKDSPFSESSFEYRIKV